ncbi:hypothetical protein Tco_1125630 [Tanacetum coccineum]|uniref:Uncharacterized protein n=1 Tax=Tanacetum coccineum TaxID=301880 RepID=A0ABQ5JB88_9ASTR
MVEKFIMKFHHLSDHNKEEETKEDDNPHETNNVLEIFKIERNLSGNTYDIHNFKTYDEYERELNNDIAKGIEEPWSENRVPYQLCDHICKPHRFKKGETKWSMCTYDIDGFCNGGKLPGMVRVGSITYFQDHTWYDELADRKLKDETLALKAKIEGSWGDATPGVMKFCKWLNNSFENFHELDYDKLRNQEHEEQKVNLNPEPSNCKIRRFEMMKYSFDDDEECITIKESEYLNYSKDSLDAYRELLRLINEGWVVTTPAE